MQDWTGHLCAAFFPLQLTSALSHFSIVIRSSNAKPDPWGTWCVTWDKSLKITVFVSHLSKNYSRRIILPQGAFSPITCWMCTRKIFTTWWPSNYYINWTIRIVIAHIFISPFITLTKPRNPKLYQVDLYYPGLRQITVWLCPAQSLWFCFFNSKVKFLVQIFFVGTLTLYSEVITE